MIDAQNAAAAPQFRNCADDRARRPIGADLEAADPARPDLEDDPR